MARHMSRVTVFITMRLFPSPLARSSTQSRNADHRVRRGWSAALVAVTLMALVIGVPASGAQPRTDAFTLGSEPWIDSDCAGEVAVVAASDSRAQPDLYSAVTLAAALGTNCVILAGHRGESMPATQRARLTASIGTVYVVGGTAAVPSSKLAGRTVERVSGTDRWLTAAAIGERAASLPESTEPGQFASFSAVSAGWNHTCALRTDRTLQCWGDSSVGKTDPPAGQFIAVSTGLDHSCAVSTSREVQCWGSNTAGKASAPNGTFASVSAGSWRHSCAVRTDGTLECWGDASLTAETPSGEYTAVVAGTGHSCALSVDGTVTCWGGGIHGETDEPPGRFTAISGSGNHTCALRQSEALHCWGYNGSGNDGRAVAPSGQFKAVSAGGAHTCALRTDERVQCWGYNADGEADAPSGAFTSVSAGFWHSCGLRTDGAMVCWGRNGSGQSEVPLR